MVHASGIRGKPVPNNDKPSTAQEWAGVIVTGFALAALIAIVLVAIFQLPSASRSQNIVALSTAAFGVIGAVIGAFFGVRAANRATDKVSKANDHLASMVATDPADVHRESPKEPT
jgi:hypothetical protein